MNALHVLFVFMSPLQNEGILPYKSSTSPCHRQGVASLWGWSMGVLGAGTPIHLGLSMSWIACTACCTNIMQLGCTLIAWWLCRPLW